MSRTGSFPLPLALSLLKKYGGDRPVVFDPFCGKGTSLLAARLLGYSAYGLDVAPEAIICTRAKMVDVHKEGVLEYLASFPKRPKRSVSAPVSVRTFFHLQTLREIINARRKLLHDIQAGGQRVRNNATFSLAALLGILHGHTSFSLSLPCAHAFSMSPSYVRRFAKRHHLTKPRRAIKACLAVKIARCFRHTVPSPVPYRVLRGSAEFSAQRFPDLIGKVDLILTSPPYLNAQTYAKDNWLRLWLLGFDSKRLQRRYLETGDIKKYSDHMRLVFAELFKLLRPGGRLICIAGDITLRKKQKRLGRRVVFKTAELLAKIISTPGLGFKIEHTISHQIPSPQRYFHALSSTNGHTKRRLVERVVIARRLPTRSRSK